MNKVLLIGFALLPLVAGCTRFVQRIDGESLVLAGQTPGRLLEEHIDPKSVIVRSTYVTTDKTTTYEPSRDYTLDARAGTIARTPTSRIPDYATNSLFGKADFDHSKFPGYGNNPFFVFVDYNAPRASTWAKPQDVSAMLPKTIAKLRDGTPMKIVAYGDSITAGGEASTVNLQYQSRYVAHLRSQFPKANITLENGATGGDSTVNGLQRLEEKVLSRSPDLVLIAFGMNDHNVNGIPLPAFKSNLKEIATKIRERNGAEVIFLTTFPPNPEWHFSSHQMEKYAAATEEAARELNAPCADVYGAFQKALARKDAPSLLGNNINHPNDFGHWLYLQALVALKL